MKKKEFKIGDMVLTVANGICCISDEVEMDMSGSGMKKYYILIPENDKATKLFIPVESAHERIRLAMTRDEALQILEHVEEFDQLIIENEKEREKIYKEALRSSDPLLLIASIKNIIARIKEREAEGKKSTVIDDKYFKLTMHKLHAEIAYALGCSENEITEMMKKRFS